jgi:hypothetical protein
LMMVFEVNTDCKSRLFLLTPYILCFRGFISFIFLCASIYLGLVILSWGNLQFSVSIFYVMLITWVVALHVRLITGDVSSTTRKIKHEGFNITYRTVGMWSTLWTIACLWGIPRE